MTPTLDERQKHVELGLSVPIVVLSASKNHALYMEGGATASVNYAKNTGERGNFGLGLRVGAGYVGQWAPGLRLGVGAATQHQYLLKSPTPYAWGAEGSIHLSYQTPRLAGPLRLTAGIDATVGVNGVVGEGPSSRLLSTQASGYLGFAF